MWPLRLPLSPAAMLGLIFSFASIRAEDIPEGVMFRRQVVGTGGASTSTTPPTTSTPQDSTSTDTTTPSTDTTPSQRTSATTPTSVSISTTTSDGSTITSTVSTSSVSSTSTGPVSTDTSSRLVKIGSTTIDASTLSHKTTITTPLITSHTTRSTFTSVFTSAGQEFSSLVTSDEVVASTTGFATATIAPSLAGGGGSGSNLTTHTKAIIGGVVGGVGGAILIGGLAVVGWRLWGKKRRANAASSQNYDADAFRNSQNDSLHKEDNARLASPYADGSERYHNPNGSVNTASNF